MTDTRAKTIRPIWDYLNMLYVVGLLVAFYSSILMVGVPILLGTNPTFHDFIFKDTGDFIFSLFCAALLVVILPLLAVPFLSSIFGAYRLGEWMYRRRISTYANLVGPESSAVARAEVDLADSLCREGRLFEAEFLYQKALAVFGRVKFLPHVRSSIQARYARLLQAEGREDQTVQVAGWFKFCLGLGRALLLLAAPVILPILFILIPWYGFAYATSYAGNMEPVEQFQNFAGKMPGELAYIASSYGSPLGYQAQCYRWGNREFGQRDKLAQATLETAVALDQRTLPVDHPWRMKDVSNLVDLYRNHNDVSAAIRVLEQTLGVCGRAVPNRSYSPLLEIPQDFRTTLLRVFGYSHTAASLYALGSLYEQVGDYKKSADTYLKVLTINESAYGKEDPVLLYSLKRLSTAYEFDLVQGDATEQLRKRIVTLQEKLSPPKGDVALVHALDDLGWHYISYGEYRLALPVLQRALDIAQTTGTFKDAAGDLVGGTALIYLKQRKYSQAHAVLARVLRDRQSYAGPLRDRLSQCLCESGEVNCAQGNLNQAETELQESIDLHLQSNQPNYGGLSARLIALGNLYRLKGEYAKSEALLQGALRLRQGSADHLSQVRPLQELANLYRDRGDYTRAELLYKQVRDLLEKTMPADSGRLAQFFHDYANYLQKTHHFEQATLFEQRASAIDSKQG